ncbi:MAG: response regulator [Planctomycetota bacterium]
MKSDSTVFVVDDDPDVRQSLTRLMEEVQQPVQAFGDAEGFLEAYDPTNAGCLVLDVRMPGMSGTELQRKLLADGVTIPIIIITGHGDVPMAVETMQRGAIGFIEKPIRPQVLIDRIQQALALDSECRRSKAEHAALAARVALLTPREREVVDLAVSGLTNKGIAAQLGVSPQAIDSHRVKAMTKMGADSVPELVKLMLKIDAG